MERQASLALIEDVPKAARYASTSASPTFGTPERAFSNSHFADKTPQSGFSPWVDMGLPPGSAPILGA